MATILPITPFASSQDAQLAGQLGQAWFEPGPQGLGMTRYMLVKATVAITAPQGKAILWATTNAFTLGDHAGAAAAKETVAGVIPGDFVGSIAVGDYVLIARSSLYVNAMVAISVAAVTLLTTDTNGRLTSSGTAAGNTLGQTLLAAPGSTTVAVPVILT